MSRSSWETAFSLTSAGLERAKMRRSERSARDEILRWFLLRPVDLQILERFVADGKTPTGFAGPQFFALMDRLEALPALRNMRPYTATQLALALGLARTLFRSEPIPLQQCIQVRRLAVVAA